MSKAKLGIGGPLGIVAGTVVIEIASQQLERFVPQTEPVLSRQIIPNAPFLGAVDVRDLGTLGFTVRELLRLVKGGKPKIVNIIANYGTKVLLRSQGINPLPDKNKPQNFQRKRFSYQLPMP